MADKRVQNWQSPLLLGMVTYGGKLKQIVWVPEAGWFYWATECTISSAHGRWVTSTFLFSASIYIQDLRLRLFILSFFTQGQTFELWCETWIMNVVSDFSFPSHRTNCGGNHSRMLQSRLLQCWGQLGLTLPFFNPCKGVLVYIGQEHKGKDWSGYKLHFSPKERRHMGQVQKRRRCGVFFFSNSNFNRGGGGGVWKQTSTFEDRRWSHWLTSTHPTPMVLHPQQVEGDGLPQWPMPGKLHM